MAEDNLFEPSVRPNQNVTGNGNRLPNLPENPLQKLQVTRYCFDYLQRCTTLKRPPLSLRVTGLNRLLLPIKLQILSEAETKALDAALKAKNQEINELLTELAEDIIEYQPLSKAQKSKWYKYYQKKITFYKSQENTKWKEWPSKKKPTKQKSKSRKRKERIIKEEANTFLGEGSVRNLTNISVPPEVISLLGKGLGFVCTPEVDIPQLRLDGRRLTNKLLNKAHFEENILNAVQANPVPNEDNQPIPETFVSELPQKLRRPNYYKTKCRTSNADTNIAVQIITDNLNSLPRNYKIKTRKKNLSTLHEEGMKWLKNKINNNEISVVEADKGGAILLVDPHFLETKVMEKVQNEELYEKLPGDPRKDQYNKLINIWRIGQVEKIVSTDECNNIVGLTKNGNKSTNSIFKPGDTYFVPSLKIHKVSPENLTPEKAHEIPARIITCLQDSTTKRSDVFIAEKWLQKLQKDYCKDLVESTDETLIWLDDLNNTEGLINRKLKGFTFDFEALYDSLSPELVIRALTQAISECYPNWSANFIDWFTNLLKFSMESAVGVFKDNWYKPNKGIPTGGSCSVPLANIAVYFVLYNAIYSNQNKMNNIVSIKRFIDDGVGIHYMSPREFSLWKNFLTDEVRKVGLNIKESDWNIAENSSDHVNFLDIQFWIDREGKIQTDLYVKPTDSRRYLSFESCHPNHMFAGIVYTQALRIRRIVRVEYTDLYV